jgi:glycosyltransferase involved in cell wall biosynthesis
MRILAIEPYYGGSHRAFLDGWAERSGHAFTLLTLPSYFWKWRMRHAAVTLADRANALQNDGYGWDAVVCSDMLSLAEFRGLATPPVANLPAVAYFHENQLTYPARRNDVRDVHFVFTNLTTALSAQAVWWNSAFHQSTFLEALGRWARKVPDYPPSDAVERIEARSSVHWPGIETAAPRGPRSPGPMRILWSARWEHDKQPEVFFAAVERLARTGVDFRLDVVGERFGSTPEAFAKARGALADQIDQWGYLAAAEDYQAVLARADVVVSTARHEFFGMAVAEAIAAGAFPVVPRDLAYPELLEELPTELQDLAFCPPEPAPLARRLADLAERLARHGRLYDRSEQPVQAMARYAWPRAAEAMDAHLEDLAGRR